MPRSGPRRVYFGARLLTPEEDGIVRDLAGRETGGNMSEMVRTLTLEALNARGMITQPRPKGR